MISTVYIVQFVQFACFIGMAILAWRAQPQCKRLIENNKDLVIVCDEYIDQWLDTLDRVGNALEWLEPVAEWDGPIPEETDGETWSQYCRAKEAQELMKILQGEQD